MARHPSAIDKWNYVVNFWFDACDAPYSLYVRTIFPALLEAFINYYAIDMVQIFTGWVRPGGGLRGVRGGGHGKSTPKPDPHSADTKPKRGGKRTWSKTWRVWSGFDPWEWLGRQGPLRADLAARSVTPGVITMWNLYGLEQRAAYWFAVADIANDFFYTWASGVAESRYCQQQYRPWVLASSPFQGNLGVLEETPLVISEIEKARLAVYVAGNSIAVQGNGSSCTVSVRYLDDGHLDGQRLRIRHSSGVEQESGDMKMQFGRYTVSATAMSPGQWYFFSTGPGNFQMDECKYNVVGAQAIYAPPPAP